MAVILANRNDRDSAGSSAFLRHICGLAGLFNDLIVKRFVPGRVRMEVCRPNVHHRFRPRRLGPNLDVGLAEKASRTVRNKEKVWSPFGNCTYNALMAMFFLPISGVLCAAEPVIFEIFEHRDAYTLDAPPSEMHPVVLSVPSGFLYGSELPKRNFGINILTYYPSFSNPNDPHNASFGLACAGICNGRILISIENRTHSISSESPNMADYIARAELRWSKTPPYPPNVHVSDLNSKIDGFDEAFEETISTLTDRKIVQTHRVYFRKDADGQHYNLTAVCNVTDRATGCVLHFSLACNPEIYVSVNGIDGSYLDRAAEIKEKTDHFISTMVRKPFCAS